MTQSDDAQLHFLTAEEATLIKEALANRADPTARALIEKLSQSHPQLPAIAIECDHGDPISIVCNHPALCDIDFHVVDFNPRPALAASAQAAPTPVDLTINGEVISATHYVAKADLIWAYDIATLGAPSSARRAAATLALKRR